MTVDIEKLLRSLGLERYLKSFRENEIDAEVLPRPGLANEVEAVNR